MFILLLYALHVNSLYVYVLLLYKYSSLLYVFCQFEYQLSNLLLFNLLSPFLSFFLARLWTLLLRPDLQNLRHPSRERHNPQVEANASHDFGPDISIQILSLTPSLNIFSVYTTRIVSNSMTILIKFSGKFEKENVNWTSSQVVRSRIPMGGTTGKCRLP